MESDEDTNSSSPEWVLLIDPVEMRILRQNLGNFLGFQPHFFPDVAFLLARVHPNDHPQANDLFTGARNNVMFRMNSAAGTWAWLHGRSYRFEADAPQGNDPAQGQLLVMLHPAPDYYPANLLNLASDQHLKTAEVVVQSLERLNIGPTLDQMMDNACAEIVQVFDVPFAIIQLYDSQLDAFMTARYYSSAPRDQGEEYYQPIPRQTFEMLRQQMGEVIVIPDLRQTRGVVDEKLFDLVDICTLVVTALQQGDELIGVLVLATLSESHQFSSHQLALFKSYARQISDAVAHTRLLSLAQRQARSLELLNHIARTALESNTLKEMLDTLAHYITERLNASGCMVLLRDEQRGRIQPYSGFGAGIDQFSQIIRDEEDLSWARAIFEVDHTTYIEQIDRFLSDNLRLKLPADFVIPSAMMVMPLFLKERRMGLLLAGFQSPCPGFSQDELSGWEEVAAQLSLAIEKLLLLDQEQIRRSEAENLQKATAALAGQLNQSQVLENILTFLAQVVPLDTATITIQGEDGLHIVAERGTTHNQHDPNQIVPPDFPLFQQLIETDGPVLFAAPDNRHVLGIHHMDRPRDWMGAPLVAFGHRIGYLIIGSWKLGVFTPAHARNLQTFAQQAAIAIENARLFEQVRQGRERLQQLSHRLVEVQEEERRTLSRELHDEIGQVLTGLAYTLEMSQRLEGAALHNTLVEAQQMVTVLMRQVRELSLNLRPSILDDLGLQAALEWLFNRFHQQTGIEVHFYRDTLPENLNNRIAITAFRVVQEALTNTARHARVTELFVWMSHTQYELMLQIEDHGAGFNANQEEQHYDSSGITGMAERVSLVGGRFEILSTPGHGTLVTAVLPIK